MARLGANNDDEGAGGSSAVDAAKATGKSTIRLPATVTAVLKKWRRHQ